MKLILLGAPGSGKGTQAQIICENIDIPHISSGDIFRKNISEKTEIGVIAKSYIDKGELVPDDVTVKMISDRLHEDDCRNGFILDGFPRTIPQAEMLSEHIPVDLVIELDIENEKLMNRLTGRRSCSKCGAPFHISTYDKPTCSHCGGQLVQREDDTVDTVNKRLSVYEKQTKPLISFYEEKGLLKKFNADQNPQELYKEIEKVLRELK